MVSASWQNVFSLCEIKSRDQSQGSHSLVTHTTLRKNRRNYRRKQSVCNWGETETFTFNLSVVKKSIQRKKNGAVFAYNNIEALIVILIAGY